MVNNHGDRKSPNWGCGTPSKWPNFMAYKWGFPGLLTKWDDPSGRFPSFHGHSFQPLSLQAMTSHFGTATPTPREPTVPRLLLEIVTVKDGRAEAFFFFFKFSAGSGVRKFAPEKRDEVCLFGCKKTPDLFELVFGFPMFGGNFHADSVDITFGGYFFAAFPSPKKTTNLGLFQIYSSTCCHYLDSSVCSIFPSSNSLLEFRYNHCLLDSHRSILKFWVIFREHIPMGSMGLVYLPTFTYQKSTIHGSVYKYTVRPMDPLKKYEVSIYTIVVLTSEWIQPQRFAPFFFFGPMDPWYKYG